MRYSDGIGDGQLELKLFQFVSRLLLAVNRSQAAGFGSGPKTAVRSYKSSRQGQAKKSGISKKTGHPGAHYSCQLPVNGYIRQPGKRCRLAGPYISMKSVYLFSAALFLLTIFMARRLSAQRPSVEMVGVSGQVIVVVTDGWHAVSGKAYAFERTDGHWAERFSFSVVIGAKGFGIGAMPDAASSYRGGSAKKEGDNKSPSGVYTFGTVFGYAPPEEAQWLKMPYIEATNDLICVDDVESASYNKLVKIGTAETDYTSFEKMHMHSNEYKWGVFINHNADEIKKGKGSCIFLHIWTDDHTGTAGCTAMSEEDMLKVLAWIDSSKNPLLVQMPVEVYRQISEKMELPSVQFP